MVATFQAGDVPVFLLSLKAGGVGLNLTQATHVIHYDRWWNPAVEDQASDRAHRIGQRRAVQIHRLICEGTVEDRIAQILERKRSLAETIVGEGESWIGDLSNDDLAELVRLGAPGEEL
jgi:SNF2 family DNA or RNA helicase